MRSSARARWRCRTSRAGRVQPGPRVLVAKQVIRQPSWSVSRSCAPGWGRSRRAMTRIPSGQCCGPNRAGDRVGVVGVGIQAVSSATWAPSRGSPSPSSAARHACSGIASIAALTVSWAGNPTEYSSPSVGDVVQERLRTGAGVGADQHLAALELGQLSQRRVQRARCGRRCSNGEALPGPQIQRRAPRRCRARRGRRTRTSARTRTRVLKVGSAPCLSECAVTSVASMSTITCPPSRAPGVPASGRRRAHTAARASSPRLPGSRRPRRRCPRPGPRSAATPSDRRRPARTPAAGRGPPRHRPGSRRPARPRSRHRAAPCPGHEPRAAERHGASARDSAAIQTRDPDRLPQQQRARGRDQRLADRIENKTRSRVTLHLRSAFQPVDLETSQSQESRAGQALPCFTRRDHHPAT